MLRFDEGDAVVARHPSGVEVAVPEPAEEFRVVAMPERSKDRSPDGSHQGLTRALIPAVLVGIGVGVGLLVAYAALPVLKVVAVAVLLALVLRTVARGLERIGASPTGARSRQENRRARSLHAPKSAGAGTTEFGSFWRGS